jgi:hypothetical protein
MDAVAPDCAELQVRSSRHGMGSCEGIDGSASQVTDPARLLLSNAYPALCHDVMEFEASIIFEFVWWRLPWGAVNQAHGFSTRGPAIGGECVPLHASAVINQMRIVLTVTSVEQLDCKKSTSISRDGFLYFRSEGGWKDADRVCRPAEHDLIPVFSGDHRRDTGIQGFVGAAPSISCSSRTSRALTPRVCRSRNRSEVPRRGRVPGPERVQVRSNGLHVLISPTFACASPPWPRRVSHVHRDSPSIVSKSPCAGCV